METAGLSRTYRSGDVRPIALVFFFFFSLPFLGQGFGGLALSNAQFSGHPAMSIVLLVIGGAVGVWCAFTLCVWVSSSNTAESWSAIASAESPVSSVRP